MSLYKSHYMADAAAFCAKASFYILWQPDLWRYAETPHTYKVTFVIDVVYKKNVTTYMIFCSVFTNQSNKRLNLYYFNI